MLHVGGGGPLFASEPVTRFNLFVDFFFALSGFVLAAAYGDRLVKGFAVGRYMLLRLGRIYPLHLAMVAVYVVSEVGFALLRQDSWSVREPFSGSHDLSTLAASLLLLGPWFEPPLQMYNGQSWSVAVEVWLYLAFALSLRFIPRLGWWLLPALAFAGLAFILQAEWPAYRVQMLRGLVGFGLGVATWRLWLAAPPRLTSPSVAAATLAELAVTGAIAAHIAFWSRSPGAYAAAALLFALAVAIFAADRGLVSRLLHRAPFVWLGVVSYSLYMVHVLAIARLEGLIRFAVSGEIATLGSSAAPLTIDDPWLATALSFALVAACLPIAWLAWRFVEAPARDWSRRRAARWGAGDAETAAPTI